MWDTDNHRLEPVSRGGDSTSKWAGRTRSLFTQRISGSLSQGTMGPISGPSAAASVLGTSTEDVLGGLAPTRGDPAPSSSQPTPSPCAFRPLSSPQRCGFHLCPLITSALKTDFRGHWHSLSSVNISFVCWFSFLGASVPSGELQNITYLNNSFWGCEMFHLFLSSVLYQRGTLGSTSLLSFVYHFNVAEATTA